MWSRHGLAEPAGLSWGRRNEISARAAGGLCREDGHIPHAPKSCDIWLHTHVAGGGIFSLSNLGRWGGSGPKDSGRSGPGFCPSSAAQVPKGHRRASPLPVSTPSVPIRPRETRWASEAPARQGVRPGPPRSEGPDAWLKALCHCLAILTIFEQEICVVLLPWALHGPWLVSLRGSSHVSASLETPFRLGPVRGWEAPICCTWSPPPSATRPPLGTSPLFHP